MLPAIFGRSKPPEEIDPFRLLGDGWVAWATISTKILGGDTAVAFAGFSGVGSCCVVDRPRYRPRTVGGVHLEVISHLRCCRRSASGALGNEHHVLVAFNAAVLLEESLLFLVRCMG